MIEPQLESTSTPELTGDKSALKSATIQGAILSIVATIGSLAAIVAAGAPSEILLPAVMGAATAVWGNVLSILGRVRAVNKIK